MFKVGDRVKYSPIGIRRLGRGLEGMRGNVLEYLPNKYTKPWVRIVWDGGTIYTHAEENIAHTED